MGKILYYKIKTNFIQFSTVLFSCVLTYSVLSNISRLNIILDCPDFLPLSFYPFSTQSEIENLETS